MVELYDKFSGSLSSESVYRFTEELDTLILKSENPTIGVVKILSLEIESTEGEGFFLEKTFRYTLDGLNWSDWYSLSEEVLKSIDIKRNHFFDIEYKFVCRKELGSKEFNFPEFKSVGLIFEYEIPEEPKIYKDHFFRKYFSFYNHNSIEWSLNLLKKIYKLGILPKFIERRDNKNWSDSDFIDFWWSFIYPLALRLNYNEVYKSLLWYPELLKKYLEQKGIFLGSGTGLGECVYLMSYSYDEISRRGSLSILENKRILPKEFSNITIRGELVRLIDKKDTDEFLASIIYPEENGWIVGKTCPLFSETNFYKGYIKGYEFTEEVQDIGKYPLFDLFKYEVERFEGKQVIHFVTSGGIGSRDMKIDLSKLLNINSTFNYEVSLKFRTNSKRVSIIAGSKARDIIGKEIEDPFVGGGNISIEKVLNVETINDEETISFIVLGKDEENFNNFLQFKKGLDPKYLDPFISLEGDAGSDFYIWDIKVRLLDKKPIFVSSSNEMFLYLKNNNYLYTLEELREIIQSYLLPFSVNLNLNGYE